MNDDRPDSTRDIAIGTRQDLAAIKEMLKDHITDTRQHRDAIAMRIEQDRDAVVGRIEQVEHEISKHHDILQQIKGAKILASGLVATVTTVGIGAMAKVFGVIR